MRDAERAIALYVSHIHVLNILGRAAGRDAEGAVPMYFALAVLNVYDPIPLLQLLKKYPS